MKRTNGNQVRHRLSVALKMSQSMSTMTLAHVLSPLLHWHPNPRTMKTQGSYVTDRASRFRSLRTMPFLWLLLLLLAGSSFFSNIKVAADPLGEENVHVAEEDMPGSVRFENPSKRYTIGDEFAHGYFAQVYHATPIGQPHVKVSQSHSFTKQCSLASLGSLVAARGASIEVGSCSSRPILTFFFPSPSISISMTPACHQTNENGIESTCPHGHQ